MVLAEQDHRAQRLRLDKTVFYFLGHEIEWLLIYKAADFTPRIKESPCDGFTGRVIADVATDSPPLEA